MALKLKEGKTLTDSRGNVYTDAYLVIDKNNGNKRLKTQLFDIEIYKDQGARNEGLEFICTHSIEVYGAEFNTFFTPAAITAGSNQYAQAYAYVKQLTLDGELVYKDWNDV